MLKVQEMLDDKKVIFNYKHDSIITYLKFSDDNLSLFMGDE